jgi:hypothetical protein
MSEVQDDSERQLWMAIRKEVSALRHASRDRHARSSEALRIKLRQRREAFFGMMRSERGSITDAEIDRLLRFEDRFTALLQRTGR